MGICEHILVLVLIIAKGDVGNNRILWKYTMQ